MPSNSELSLRHNDRQKYPEGVAFMDGQYLPMSEAKISVLDWGFLHSDATYDTVHVWKGSFFRLDLHLERFTKGLEKLRMSIPYSKSDLSEILHNCVALSQHRDAYVEMLCTRGVSPTFSRDPRDAENRFMAFAVPYGSVADADQMRHGLHVAVSNLVRISPRSVDPSVKNYHWLDLVMGQYEAFDRGAVTAILLDTEGNIAEGPGFNVFMVKGGELFTPEYGVLPGITRRSVFDLCREFSISCIGRSITPTELIAADEVFV
ncbi:MAG: branched-chain amino acid transferase, partial [Sneathiella sp.]